ncbi:MAG: tRNA (adenosine(37)-N6)-threonylcarbamoyltransferase complex dimerization subunit type 1 TsaB [Deltaproteobacteria bacterium]|nr:tRNA (adenosine(37)-N6)-threonylcarbamoyltransferase complex dimerization subunit type 1 TsaB [Deltaproteobacteria bacterium]
MSARPALCIDSAAAVACVGVVGPRGALAERWLRQKKAHAEQMYGAIEQVLADAGCGLRDLAAVVVGLGPGSFIGVRVAVATAKGLALGAGTPLIGVSSLAALALSPCRGGRMGVAVDAKKGQVYAGIYDVADAAAEDSAGALAPLATVVDARAIDPEPCARLLVEHAPIDLLVGDGSSRYAEAFTVVAEIPRLLVEPQPAALYALAAARLAADDFDDPSALKPVYARRSEAEEKRFGATVRRSFPDSRYPRGRTPV